MIVSVNGRERELERGETIEELLEGLGLTSRYALVERNGEPVERRLYGSQVLQDGDVLTVARPVAGG